VSAPALVVLDTAEEAKERCAAAIADALAEDPMPRLVLAGGQTPRLAYQFLAQRCTESLDWRRVEFWFGDERCVAPTHPLSNYRLAEETLFQPLRVTLENVHRMLGELGAEEGAERYAARLQELWDGSPVFTVALLGLGPEGHTASLYPGSPALAALELAVGVRVPAASPERITLTPKALCGAERVFFLLTGPEKSLALRAALQAGPSDPSVPASCIRGRCETVIFCDRAALES